PEGRAKRLAEAEPLTFDLADEGGADVYARRRKLVLVYRANELAQSAVRLIRHFRHLPRGGWHGVLVNGPHQNACVFRVLALRSPRSTHVNKTFRARFGMPPGEWRHDDVNKQ